MKKIFIYNSFEALKSDSDILRLESGKTDEKEILELINILRISLKPRNDRKAKINK